ncbi:MAG: DMT family transporter [Rubrivivax sp.]|nr:DMT family transporter [Rubrivivax sp.]
MTRLPSPWLFALVVSIWGTTWHAIVYQLQHGSPEFGVSLRFGLAGCLVLAWAAWRGDSLRVPLRAHRLLALQGVFMYSLSYLCVYHAERHVASGLVAVGYSASPLLAGLGAWALWRTPLKARFLFGGACGVAGVALIFWPALSASSASRSAAMGLGFTVAAVLLSAVGALAASRNRHWSLAFWPALGWGLLYGCLSSAVVLGLTGQPLVWPTAVSWWLSLVYLAVAGTVLAFGGFLTLQQRLGPGKAATVGVMTPVLALVVSTALEGFRPDAHTAAGVALAVLGNVLMLRPDALPARR